MVRQRGLNEQAEGPKFFLAGLFAEEAAHASNNRRFSLEFNASPAHHCSRGGSDVVRINPSGVTWRTHGQIRQRLGRRLPLPSPVYATFPEGDGKEKNTIHGSRRASWKPSLPAPTHTRAEMSCPVKVSWSRRGDSPGAREKRRRSVPESRSRTRMMIRDSHSDSSKSAYRRGYLAINLSPLC